MRLAVVPGVPGGADDTDVRIRFSLSNVMKASDLSEYTGELRASAQVRLTDRYGGIAQTTQDFPLAFNVPCVPTAPTIDKSLCDITTTLDTVIPGAAAEHPRNLGHGPGEGLRRRSRRGRRHDRGQSLFAVQGVFVP